MKKLLLAVAGLAVSCACGGGGSGGGGGTPVPTSPAGITVAISPLTGITIDQGQQVRFAATIENDSSAKGVTWSCSGTGLVGAACGTFTSVTATSATYNAPSGNSAGLSVTVTATSVADPTKSGSAPVEVCPLPAITTASLTNATPNTNYSVTLQATGGAGTLIWTLAGGSLPVGLSLSSAGVITGDPTDSGISTFAAQVTDSSVAASGPASTQGQLSLTVVTLLAITTTSLPAGSEGITYLAGIGATGGTPPYTWSLAQGSLPAGLTLQAGSGVISGSPTAQGNFIFTVATEDSGPTPQSQTESLTIAIGLPAPLNITTSSLLDGLVNTPYTASLAATGGTPPYMWSIQTGALPASMSLHGSVVTGTPSSTGTANLTAMVTDSSSPPETQTQPLTLTVNNAPEACTSAGNNAVLQGSYAFSLAGFNDVGFLTIVGSFTADGTGRITAGEVDTNGVLGAQHGNITSSASSYSVGPDNRGCATVVTPFGTLITHFAMGTISSGTATAGRIIEWDSPSASAFIAAGQILRQTPSTFASGLSGSYVFHTVGWDASSLGGRDVCVGVINASGNTFTGLEQDCNDAWTISNAANPGIAGTFTKLNANGRGTGIVSLGDTNANVTFYATSTSKLLVVNADSGPFVSGEWDLQNMPAGGSGFTQASLDGNMVFSLSGLSLGGTASAVSVETATADGSSSLALTFYEDRAGVMQVPGTYACTYYVEPNGRVTLSSSTDSCGGATPVLYLAGLNTGFIVDASPGVDTGSFEPQSAGPFTDASLAQSFFSGIDEAAIQTLQTEVDAVALDGRGNIGGTSDISSMSAQDSASSFLAVTYAVNPDGSFTESASGGAVTGVIVSNSKLVIFSPSTLETPLPTLLVMQR